MNIILKSNVEKLGRFGDVVKVADGYARNYLLPKGLAVEATKSNQKQHDADKEAYLKKEAARRAKAEAVKAEMESFVLTFTRKAGEDDRLFGSVTSHDVDDALKAKGYALTEKRSVQLDDPIKRLGLHTVSVRLHTDVTADVRVDVLKEE